MGEFFHDEMRLLDLLERRADGTRRGVWAGAHRGLMGSGDVARLMTHRPWAPDQAREAARSARVAFRIEGRLRASRWREKGLGGEGGRGGSEAGPGLVLPGREEEGGLAAAVHVDFAGGDLRVLFFAALLGPGDGFAEWAGVLAVERVGNGGGDGAGAGVADEHAGPRDRLQGGPVEADCAAEAQDHEPFAYCLEFTGHGIGLRREDAVCQWLPANALPI